MSGVNKVVLVGHVGADLELRKIQGDVSVTSFALATSETIKKNGLKVEQTDWHQIIMWRTLADVAVKLLKKGKLVFVEGKLKTRSYQDKEGINRYTTEVVAENFTMLGRKSDFENTPVSSGTPKSEDDFVSPVDESGDLPF